MHSLALGLFLPLFFSPPNEGGGMALWAHWITSMSPMKNQHPSYIRFRLGRWTNWNNRERWKRAPKIVRESSRALEYEVIHHNLFNERDPPPLRVVVFVFDMIKFNILFFFSYPASCRIPLLCVHPTDEKRTNVIDCGLSTLAWLTFLANQNKFNHHRSSFSTWTLTNLFVALKFLQIRLNRIHSSWTLWVFSPFHFLVFAGYWCVCV